MARYGQNGLCTPPEEGVEIVDLRTDSHMKLTPAVRQAMALATDGPGKTMEDVTTRQLEHRIAKMFNKESSIFVSTGTLANLLAVSYHCKGRGQEVIMGDSSHLFLKEQGGVSQYLGLHVRAIPNLNNGTFDLATLKTLIRDGNDAHEPITGLICVENTHNFCGGEPLPLDFLVRLRKIADRHGLPIHMDGARVFNAAVALGVSLAEVTENVDSISFSVSKGVGAPIGCMLIGTSDLVKNARRMCFGIGGIWSTPGPLAAAVMVCLDDVRERFVKDHENAAMLAEKLEEIGRGVFRVIPAIIRTNTILIEIVRDGLSEIEFGKLLGQASAKSDEEAGNICGQAFTLRPKIIRLIIYSSLTEEHLLMAVRKFRAVVDKISKDRKWVETAKL